MRRTLNDAATALGAVSDTPRLDAELLMAHALGVARETLLLSRMEDSAPEAFAALLARRLQGEPVAYIIGRRAFWTIELAVGPGVLIPRPDSETLIEAALAHYGAKGPRDVLDLGTGPGTLLLAALAEWPHARGIGVDASEAALGYARANAVALGLDARAEFRHGDWGDGLDKRFDLILCNPPYVVDGADLPREVRAFEPASALFAGPEGLDDYRRLAPHIARLLDREGLACIEIGADQANSVPPLFAAAGLEASLRHDLAGRPRCVVLRHP